jgi:dihydrofolate synthase/folylpolyglutamate synthase
VAWAGEDFGADVLEEGDGHLRVRLRDGPFALEVSLPLLGAHQAANAAMALACLRRAGGHGDAALAEAAREALPRVALPGRIEVVRRAPTVVVDAAHTAASARALAAALARLPRRRVRLVLSISAGKDVDAILAALLPLAHEVTATRAEPARSLAPAEIAAAVRARAPGLALRVVPNPHLALRAAAEGLAAEDLLCATGSVYLAGIARRVLASPRPAADVEVSRRAPAAPASPSRG